jgi:hypothetical protein
VTDSPAALLACIEQAGQQSVQLLRRLLPLFGLDADSSTSSSSTLPLPSQVRHPDLVLYADNKTNKF